MVTMNKNSLVQQVETLAGDRGVQPLRLTIAGRSKITLYAAPKPEERDDRVFPHMWVHRLRIRRNRDSLSITADRWDALPEASPTEQIVHEWRAVGNWIGLSPPVTFELKQSLLSGGNQNFHDWTEEIWPEDKVKWEYQQWKSIRDAELYDTNRIVNPRYTRIIGFVYASCADKEKARIARILLDLNIAASLYHFATDDFREQVVEDYARPYKPEFQDQRKEKLRQSKFGFEMAMVGLDVKEIVGSTHMHGPPLAQEEFRSSLQTQIETFRRSRIENRRIDDPEAEVTLYIVPSALEALLGAKFSFEPGKLLAPKVADESI